MAPAGRDRRRPRAPAAPAGRARGRPASYRAAFDAAGLTAADFEDEQALTALPVLEQVTLHAAGEHGMLAEPADRLFPVTTSGSTGQLLRVFRSARDQADISALWGRVLHAYGHRLLDSQVNINTGRAVA